MHGRRDPADLGEDGGGEAPGRPRKPAPFPSDIPAFVKVRERPLKTHLLGRGGTVFVCPTGWGLPGEMSLSVVRPYADLARFFTFDPSGTGESTGIRAKEDLGSRGIASDSSGMLLRLKLRPHALFGHSHGGCAALRVAINHPELVRRLVVVATTPGDGGRDPWNWRGVLGDEAPRAPLEGRGELLAVTRRIMVNSLADPRKAPEAFGGLEEKPWKVAVERFNALPKDGRMLDLKGKLQHIQAPTLVVAGARDPIVPLEAAEAIRAEVEKSELVVFEKSGHFPMLEEPEKFRVVLEEFLERD
ncbi:MAG TPA: alpha/beta hydrolase [Candidatus Thermoplasmatota archaeon]|nr:alpha/beta hydrolase [Candidatus Thermoplasmatota archaeon]